MTHRRGEEIAAVVRALRSHGIHIDDPSVADALGASVIAALEEVRRKGVRVAPSQCGAPTLSGWPCQNRKKPGNVGCEKHPNWRKR